MSSSISSSSSSSASMSEALPLSYEPSSSSSSSSSPSNSSRSLPSSSSFRAARFCGPVPFNRSPNNEFPPSPSSLSSSSESASGSSSSSSSSSSLREARTLPTSYSLHVVPVSPPKPSLAVSITAITSSLASTTRSATLSLSSTVAMSVYVTASTVRNMCLYLRTCLRGPSSSKYLRKPYMTCPHGLNTVCIWSRDGHQRRSLKLLLMSHTADEMMTSGRFG
mmetsp:Transcript_1066/g.2459  ORF Transcript_1066/g.2459 Transcript_1066/m.2459 type:complete len:222 (+) Transcript_1066:118-783(+)